MDFTHFNENGRARMVDVSEKDETKRKAVARGYIKMGADTIKAVTNGKIKKGDVLSVAQVGGICGAKKTWDLIPMCHNILLTGADIDFEIAEDRIWIEAAVKTTGKTGVEMEAYSVEDNGKGIMFHVFVYNIQDGITIDYKTGESKLSKK